MVKSQNAGILMPAWADGGIEETEDAWRQLARRAAAPAPWQPCFIWKQLQSTPMTKSKAAFCVAELGKQRLYLWTFAFKEFLAVKERRKRWNHLLTLLLWT
jgi:hypothetical protein